LIFLALGLFILEAKYTSHGVLAVGGIVAMLLGALMLIHSPMTGAGVSLGTALGVTVPFAVIVVILMRLVLRSRTWRPSVGAEQLVGGEAEVTSALVPDEVAGEFAGMVRMHGELWRATASQAMPVGAHVRVARVEGLTLHVKLASAPPAQ
jgi:membrane-bound serine protease (ClpP class)